MCLAKSSPCLCFVLTCWLLLPASGAGASTASPCAAPTQLSCESLTHPQDTPLFDPKPEFSWVCGEGETAYRQSAYQIRVTDAATDAAEGQPVWDSGRVDSPRSLNVEYDGDPLDPGKRYAWRVKAWNGSGTESAWSRPQSFALSKSPTPGYRTSLYRLQRLPQKPVSVKKLDEKTQLADFGRDAFGNLVLNLEAARKPRSLTVRFGEKLNGKRIDRYPGGSIRYYQSLAYIPAGTTRVVVHPPKNQRNTSGDAVRLPRYLGVVAPFRYVEISGPLDPLGPDNITRIAVQYPFDESASSFHCSDPLLNDIWDLCKYSIRATTYCGVYVDGDRERIPYEADAYLNQLAHYAVDREYALARHSHEYLLANPTWPTEWRQHSILIAWADYLYTGDTESLRHNYDVLKNEKLLLDSARDDGLLDTSDKPYRDIVDWPEDERDGYDMLPVNTVVNAFHYHTLRLMTDIAETLGETEDADRFRRLADDFLPRFNEVFFNTRTGLYVDGEGSTHSSLHANLFPIAFGLVPDENLPGVVEFVKSKGMACSVYVAHYLLESLFEAGQDRYALQLLTARNDRSWYNMLASGTTITLEAWDIKYKPNLDWNHAWGACPAYFIPAYIAGVRPLTPGFRSTLVRPQPGTLDSFEAKVPTPRGPVLVDYARKDGTCKLAVTVPGNTTATVAVPLADGNSNQSFLWNDQAATPEIKEGHAYFSDVPPGEHVFQVSPLSVARQPSP